MTFNEFVVGSAREGHVNLIFERGMYFLADDLQQLLRLFEEASVPFELIGGVAINVHLMEAAKRDRSFVTRDIDVLVRRSDLPQIIAAATRLGYENKRSTGGWALLAPGQTLADCTHMLFAGEKPKSSCPVLNPELDPEQKSIFGLSIPVAPLRELLILKLNALRIKDLLHIQVLDSVGFIAGIEAEVPEPLRKRLQEARVQFLKEEEEA